MSFQCAIELASKIDGVIFSAYSELTRNVAIKLVPLSQLGEELIRTWSDASNARAAGRPGDAIIFLQCWLFWDCGEINSDRQRSLDRPLPAWKEKREEERLQQACSWSAQVEGSIFYCWHLLWPRPAKVTGPDLCHICLAQNLSLERFSV